MMQFQQSEATAAQRRFPVYLVDATDGITPEDGEGGGQPQVSENGAAFANTGATLTFLANGFYYVELTAAELSTLGMLTIRFKSANTVEFNLTGQVVAFDPYAAYALASIATEARLAELDGANIPTDLSNIQSDTDDIQTRLPAALVGGAMDADVSNIQANAIDAGAIATDAIDADAIAAGAITSAEAPNLDAAITSRAVAGDAMDLVGNAIDPAAIGVGAIEADAFAAGAIDAAAIATDAIDADALATDAVDEIVDQVWNEDATGHQGAGSFGETIGDSLATGVTIHGRVNQALPAAAPAGAGGLGTVDGANMIVGIQGAKNDFDDLNDVSTAEVNTEVDNALGDARLDELVSATAGGVDPTIGSFLDLIMNADGGQTFAQATDSLEALAGASAPTVGQIADAVWDEIQAGHVDAGSFGLFLDSIVSTIQADTDDIQTRLPAALVGGRMDSDVAVMQAAVIAAATFAANAVDANALATDAGQEIADRILLRSIATGADGGRTVQDAFRLLRNLRQIAAGVLTVMEEDDITPAWTATVLTAAGNPVSSIDPA